MRWFEWVGLVGGLVGTISLIFSVAAFRRRITFRSNWAVNGLYGEANGAVAINWDESVEAIRGRQIGRHQYPVAGYWDDQLISDVDALLAEIDRRKL